jgi:hypothetical protein
MTTAQRLAAYRNELIAAGFNPYEALSLVESAAPGLLDDVEVQADLDARPAPIAEVTVALAAKVDEKSLEHATEEISSAVRNAARGGEGADDAHA